jgi:hypothetical protein
MPSIGKIFTQELACSVVMAIRGHYYNYDVSVNNKSALPPPTRPPLQPFATARLIATTYRAVDGSFPALLTLSGDIDRAASSAPHFTCETFITSSPKNSIAAPYAPPRLLTTCAPRFTVQTRHLSRQFSIVFASGIAMQRREAR